MMTFEDVLEQYEPMISASIRKLNIHRNHDSFRQEESLYGKHGTALTKRKGFSRHLLIEAYEVACSMN